MSLRVAVLISVLSWLPVLAHAQAEPSHATRRAARKHYDEGRAAAEARRWDDAQAAWQASYDLVPNTLVLVSLAGAQAQTGKLVDALANYETVLAQLDASTRQVETHVREQVAALESRLAHLHATNVPSDAQFLLDGASLPAAQLADDIGVDPGPHHVEIHARGFEVLSEQLTLADGERHRLTLRATAPLPPVASLDPPEPRPKPAPVQFGSTKEPQLDREPLRRRPALWWTVGAVVVASAAGTLTFLLLRDDEIPPPDGDGVPVMGNPAALRF